MEKTKLYFLYLFITTYHTWKKKKAAVALRQGNSIRPPLPWT